MANELTEKEIKKLRVLLNMFDITEYVSGEHRDTVVLNFRKPTILLADENIALISQKNILIDGKMTYINMTEELPREERAALFESSKRIIALSNINPSIEDLKQNWMATFFNRIFGRKQLQNKSK